MAKNARGYFASHEIANTNGYFAVLISTANCPAVNSATIARAIARIRARGGARYIKLLDGAESEEI